MPSKRTNDSVDRILEELSHEQAERGIRDSVTDRQVDAILQSLGHGSMEESSGGGSALGPIQKEDLPDITLGKGNNFNTEDRFSTAVLDDLLGDLPSMRAAKKNKPGPAAPARRPASVPEPRRMPEVEPKVEKQNNIQTVQPTQPVRSEPVPQPARPAPGTKLRPSSRPRRYSRRQKRPRSRNQDRRMQHQGIPPAPASLKPFCAAGCRKRTASTWMKEKKILPTFLAPAWPLFRMI